MGDSNEMPPDLSDEERTILAMAYHADRVRAAANNLAGWTVAFLKCKRTRTAKDVAAIEFVEGAVTLSAILVWNDLEIVSRGGWCSRARVAISLANDLVLSMPEVFSRGVNIASGEALTMEIACAIADKYATTNTAKVCLEVCRLMPELFAGPNGPAGRERGIREWRALHRVADPLPLGPDDHLRVAMERQDDVTASCEPPPRAVKATPAVKSSDPYDELVQDLRKRRATVQVALLEYMRDRKSTSFQDIADHVHGDGATEDSAIRQNVKRANEALAGKCLAISFRVGSGVVFKEHSPQ